MQRTAYSRSLWIKPYGVTFQMKASEQYFLVVLFVILYKVALTLESVYEIFSVDMELKTFRQDFHLLPL